MQLFVIIFFSIYFLSLIFYLFGLYQNKEKISNNFLPNVSVILCVRNGQDSIESILNNFSVQKYSGKVEFIIIDDDSNDNTAKKIKFFLKSDNRFKYYNTKFFSSNLKYKKKALSLGINKAKYDSLLFTDVDCHVGPYWVSSMSKYISNNDYVIGFSEIKSNNSIVSKFQSIDFKMLMFAALGCTLNNLSMACSGQNQSYKKSLFNKVNGFDKIKDLLQGDDSIFLQLSRKKNIKVCFAEDSKTHVIAKTHVKLKDFILQRIRWAGDANIMWKYNFIFFLIILSTFIANFFTIVLFLFAEQFSFLLFCLLTLKFILEFFIYCKGSFRLNKKIDLISFLLWYVIQPFYILVAGILSFLNYKFSWRDRPI